MMNSEESGMLLGLTYQLLDHYLDQPDYGWTTKLAELVPRTARRRQGFSRTKRPRLL